LTEALYTREILRYAVSIPNEGVIEAADGRAECRSKTCGSVVKAAVILNNDSRILKDFAWQVNACALGQASAAILGQGAPGKAREAIDEAQQNLADFLNGTSPDMGQWPNIESLASARPHTGRHEAILLPYRAILRAWDDAVSNKGLV